MKFLIVTLCAIFAISCGNNNDRLKEKAKMESESELQVQNQALAEKAEKMETDLSRRHRFYQAVKGVYEGTITTNQGSYQIRVTLTPSLEPVRHNRTRQLEEVAYDLNNLTLNTQVIQWDPRNSNASVGCPGTSVKPSIEIGEIIIPSSEACKNLYFINITDRGFAGSAVETSKYATQLAKQVLQGDLSYIDSIAGVIQPSTNANKYKFVAFKVTE